MANTIINTPELLDLSSSTGSIILPKGASSARPPSANSVNIDYLVVAGGGGGGTGVTASTIGTGGGGGAGGLRTSYGSTSGGGSSAESSLSLLIATNYTVTIGNGGNGGTAGSSGATNGQDSVFSSITSAGGGAAGSYRNPADSSYYAQVGGSGGGSTYRGASSTTGADGTANQGYKGGNELGNGGASAYGAGGGGGASAAGVNGSGTAPGGGGDGLALAITGSSVTYAGGGGAGGVQGYTQAVGGAGGGGAGGVGNGNAGTAGTANTGGGGGGGGKTSASGTLPGSGAAGGSGIVILRYASTINLTVVSGLTTSVLNGTVSGSTDKYTIFTSGTGTITFANSYSVPTATEGVFRFNTDTNKTEFYNGTGWKEIIDEYASGFIGPAINYFDTKLYTGNGSTQSIGGYINGAGSFNGSSSRIDLGNNSSNNSSTISVSLWFKTSGSSVATLINNGGANSGETGYFLGLNSNGTIKFDAGGGTVNGSVSYADNNWHQIVLTLNNGTYNIYVDGNQTPILTGSGAFTSTATRPTWIGQFSYTPAALEFFNGSIDQVRIYDSALSSSDVAALSNETAATATTAAFPSGQTAIATYTMDTSANGLLNTQDLSTVNYPVGAGCLALYEMNGNSNDTSGTYNGIPTNITYQGGAFDQAAVFNGSSSYISANDPNSGGGARSFSAWIKTTSTGFQSIITNGGASYASGLNMFVYNNKLYSTSGNGSGENYGPTSSADVNTGAWVHCVLTMSGTAIGSTLKTYINGTLGGTHTTTVAITDTYNAFTIGGRYINGSYAAAWFDGQIDQVRIFNTELTQAQVTTLARGIATSYSGAATNVNFNGHLDFAPDFVWIKSRNTAVRHMLTDSVRGISSQIFSNEIFGESNYAEFDSFDANGFTVSFNAATQYMNNSGTNYVAWNWKAGGAAVTNNEGTTASQVSANKDSGFSIVKYTGAGDVNVGHGLSATPNLIINKITNANGSWVVYNSISGTGKYLVLNDTASIATASEVFSAVTDTTFTHNWSGNSYSYIAYCWHSVAGYSKMGSYTGNGTTSNPVSAPSFEPSFVMIKRTDSTSNWRIYDNARGTNVELYANSSSQDVSATGYINFNSNGFEITTTGGWLNALNGTYLYMAFA